MIGASLCACFVRLLWNRHRSQNAPFLRLTPHPPFLLFSTAEVSVFTVSAKTNDGIEQFRNAAIEACYRIMYCTSDEVNARARFSGRR